MRSASSAPPGQKFFLRSGRPRGMIKTLSTGACPPPNGFRAIPHNSKCRYGERGAAAAKPKAQIILDAAKVSAASGGNSEPKQGQRSQSARGFCPRSTMRVPQPDIIEHFGNADAVPQLPERCLSRKAGIVRCCLRMKAQHAARFGIYLSGWSCWRWALTGWGHRPLYRYHAPSARGPDGILPT